MQIPRFLPIASFASILLSLAACGSSAPSKESPTPAHVIFPDSGTGADLDAAPSASTDGVTLTIISAAQTGAINTIAPAAGDIFVAVELTLANGGIATLPLVTSLFAGVTASGLQYRASPLTSGYAGACDPTASLTAGSLIECSVVFQVPQADALHTVVYTLLSDATVTAPVSSVTTCTICDDQCVDLMTDPGNCGSCGNVAGGGTCTGGVPTCASASDLVCNNQCEVESTDMCGPCGAQTACTGNVDNCLQGHCTTTKYSSAPVSCDALCGGAGCYGTSAVYGSQSDMSCDSSSQIPCSETPAAKVNGCPFFTIYCDCGG